MSCNLSSDCNGSGSGGCFAQCCDISCPPDGLCDSIVITYKVGSNTPGYPCGCPSGFVKKFFDFFIKKKERYNSVPIKESDIESNSKLGINLPPIPSFELGQDLIKNSNFVFAQGCSVPCAGITVTITTSNSCGISLGGTVGGSDCCCYHGDGTVSASLSGGGDCKASLSWTSQTVSNGGSVGLPSVQIGNSCCNLYECSRVCQSNTSLWKKKVVGNKLKISLNKVEFAKRLNKIKNIRINARKARNVRRRS